jgi:NADH-quinone oxidoreductase subunit L
VNNTANILLGMVPLLPLLAAVVITLLPRRSRIAAAATAIGAMAISCLISAGLFSQVVSRGIQRPYSFEWLQMGNVSLRLGIALDPLSSVMILMVTFVGLLIFIFSVGYMWEDERFARFFAFLSLFAAAMLGVCIANDLLLLFMSWELVGLASYLLIGFWYFKPEAAAAARKAFLTTRIGDVGLFIGMLWWFGATGTPTEAGTLLFYDGGKGCLDKEVVAKVAGMTAFGWPLSAVIGLLIFAGAMSKSGQVPLHVWLPDAMEGPTPVSALIHAATMVAAGVFLMARIYPLIEGTPALTVITWVGAVTAIFGSLVAVAQNDIKRILAYSTVSQLGYMMMGLGMGGVAVAMFHLITHAFFKALLFLGAGSVIYGCHHEQDIRHMGGLKQKMPVTFVTYGVGMLALAGLFPLAGFWSKDEILHAGWNWPLSKIPFVIGFLGAGITAFYMTRQMRLVFYGKHRGHHEAHESSGLMTMPLIVLAAAAVLLGFLFRWFPHFITGKEHPFHLTEFLALAFASTAIVLIGFYLGKKVYRDGEPSPIASRIELPVLKNKFYFDEFYRETFVRFFNFAGEFVAKLEDVLWRATVQVCAVAIMAVAWFNRIVDEYVVNGGFDLVTRRLRKSGATATKLQTGQIQTYMRIISLGLAVLVLLFAWGCDSK